MTQQLTLRLSPQEVYRLDNFLFADPEIAEAIETFCLGEGYPMLFFSGEKGAGKTHLCLAIQERLDRQSVTYLNLNELRQSAAPQALEGVVLADWVMIDDVDAIAGSDAWEEALFHLFNRLQQTPSRMVFTSRTPPSELALDLPDLRSRLSLALVFRLSLMTDEAKQAALVLQAQSRGLIMPDEVASYLLRHAGRDMPSLMRILQQLDAASLQAKRRLTIPFVKDVIHDI
ncbi:Chromosomal replication initiator protein DnaA [Methylophaga frappieri]|uniref:Chromosomal replication initiator protein DnaA n=1 Tax=Methylophaga frappieri (strain ATCC BAA-2434 / DSM 25690 / JAM7) TaxID=754477 RepID=I1YLG7_METFJ|nr:DnaA regulatory inactivator Hda [Methylophaga frappieri]AFJ03760.1 Chromosomal replication initiator protein DnaA [Methylophaga frappieri]